MTATVAYFETAERGPTLSEASLEEVLRDSLEMRLSRVAASAARGTDA